MLTPRKETFLFTFCILSVSHSLIHICVLFSDCDVNAHCANHIISLWCECNTGYVGDGKNCTLVDCGTPTVPSHAVWDPDCTNDTWGSKCPFNCLPPYQLSGTNSVSCGANGAWLSAGSCVANTWNGVIKGDITGEYTNGCRVQPAIDSLELGTYLLNCPTTSPPFPFITYLHFYTESQFQISVQGFPWYYGGVNYAFTNVVSSLWFQTRANKITKGISLNLLPFLRTLLYAGEHEQCSNLAISIPIQNYQRCAAPLVCYYRGPMPQARGQRGQCWYPTCKVSYCNAGSKLMRNGYCNALTGGGFECLPYLPAGESGCGGYNSAGEAIHPMCDPFTTFCINGTCILSDCLNGGCKYGSLCTLSGTTATCSGQGIPQLPDPWVKDMLAEVIPNLMLTETITTQAKNSTKQEILKHLDRTSALTKEKRKNILMMMPRTRELSPRSADLLEVQSCTPGIPPFCPPSTTCISLQCQSPSGSPCGPSPC